MHASSRDKMRRFVDQHLGHRREQALVVHDLGSQDVNGSYRDLFDAPRWRYVGMDMVAGDNVDLVLRTPYAWREVASNSVDVVISGQALEHVRYVWITLLEVARILKPGGVCCLIAPSSGPEHRYPVDCWRFYPTAWTPWPGSPSSTCWRCPPSGRRKATPTAATPGRTRC